MAIHGFYEKGMRNGKDGFYINIGWSDPYFYVGSLREAKKTACELVGSDPKKVTWHDMKKL